MTPTNIPEIAQAATAYLDHNKAIRTLGARNSSVIDRTLTAPPGSPGVTDLYIPASVATGDWAGQENQIARLEDGVWVFYTPFENQLIYSDGDAAFIQWNGVTWNTVSLGSDTYQVQISANDTTPAFLDTKLVAGTNITLTENNDGGNETLTIAAAGGGGGTAVTVNAETLAATKTLSNGDDVVQALDPNGVARDVVLPDPGTQDDYFIIINNSDGLSASGNTLNIKETAVGSVIQTLDDTTGQLNVNCIYDSVAGWILWS